MRCSKCDSDLSVRWYCSSCVAGWELKIAELEAQLAEFRDDYEQVVNEQCASDELHCTCVPALRKRIAELETFLANIKMTPDGNGAIGGGG